MNIGWFYKTNSSKLGNFFSLDSSLWGIYCPNLQSSLLALAFYSLVQKSKNDLVVLFYLNYCNHEKDTCDFRICPIYIRL